MALFTPLSSHRYSARSGDTTGIAAAGVLGSNRWGSTTSLRQRIRNIETGLVVNTGFTAAQLVGYDLVVGRTFTASHTGGTAGTLTGENTQMRSAATVEATRLTDFRFATTAALGGGTVTPDTALLGQDIVWALAATAGAKIQKVYDFTDSELGGLILQQDEGVLMRNLVAEGAAGTVQFWWTVAWDEGLIG